MKKIISKTKKGAASFYMVAFSTLVLIIIATSFAAVIISEVTRTANDDLSKSAYDSAMAGVEDAKLVVHSYQKCIEENDNGEFCTKVRGEIENTSSDSESNDGDGKCNQVGWLLGRLDENGGGEVLIQESEIENNMSQAYTCVKISLPGDYSGALSSGEQFKVIKAKFKNDGIADKVKSVIINWSSGSESGDLNYNNFTGGKVTFSKDVSMPPTIAVSMIQTGQSFDLDSFTRTIGRTTNRGTLFLVPTREDNLEKQSDTYISAYDGNEGANHIEEDGFLKSNDKTAKNLPYAVYCGNASDGYACSATIDIPRPIGNTDRNPDTFYFVVTQPYAGDTYTDFNVLFSCGNEACNEGKDVPEAEKNYAKLDGVQIKIDSTGRANDMYRRVEVRLDGDPNYAFSIMGPLELLNNEEDTPSLKKDLTVTCEWNLGVNPENVTCP